MQADSTQDKRQEALQQIYSTHHKTGKRLGFTFGGSEKGSLFAEWIGIERDVLDIGCRDGTLTQYYCAGNHVVGVDVDQEALKQCERLTGITTQWLDISNGLPFADGSFDVVVASEVFEHLPWPHQAAQEVARVLRPGGRFVGSVPNAFRLKNRLLFLVGKEFEVDPTHLRHFSPASLKQMLDASFTHIQIIPAIGRLVRAHGPLFANTLLWRCEKPGR
jgi:SAM-dependent methyltransferase